MKKDFLVLSKEYYGLEAYENEDWSEAHSINAYDHQEAVEKWAEESDAEGDYNIIGNSEHGPVKVKCQTTGIIKSFNIEAYQEPVYNAREII